MIVESNRPVPQTIPPWLEVGLGELGVAEFDGERHNKRIIEYHKATTLKATTDETPWCASFCNWCLMQVGIHGTDSAAARSFLKLGAAVPRDRWRLGDIAVFSRGSNPSQGHVGFILDIYGGMVDLLSGNQSNRVCVAKYGTSRLLDIRRPTPSL